MKPLYPLTFLAVSIILSMPFIGLSQFKKKDLLINAGIASGTGYPGSPGTTANGGIPTTNLSTEYTFINLLSLGIYGAYTYSYFKFDHPQVGYKDVWKGWDVGIKSTFHFSPLFIKNETHDLYLAAFAGYTTRAMVYDKSNIYRDFLNYKVDDFSFGGILGYRYLLTPKVGLYGEAGLSRKFFLGGGASLNINLK
jgi:hypothetical protein